MTSKLHVEEAKMSDVAVSMAATWSHPCTPAERNWVAFGNEQTSTRATERESANLATVAVSRQQRASGFFDIHPLHAFQASHVDPDTTLHWLPPGNPPSTERRGHVLQQTRVHGNHREPVEETGLSISNATDTLSDCRLEPHNSARGRYTNKNNLVSSEHRWVFA